MKKRIIIADINSRCTQGVLTGHGIAVAENYRQLSSDDTEIVVAGGPAYAKRFPDAIILDYDADASLPNKENKRRNLHNIRQLFRLCPNDTIVFQSSAVATTFLGIALYKPRTCRVFMIQYNTMGLDSSMKRILYRLAQRNIRGIICPNEEIGKAYGLPYCVVPDYIYTGTDTNQAVTDEDKKYDFCMVGIISRDKGMIEAAAGLAGSPYRVILAGRPSSVDIEQELQAIARSANNIELRLRYLDEAEYADVILSSRYCILNYSGAYSEHSSGVVFDILFKGIPIIGRKCKSLQFIEDYGMGYLFEDISEWDISALPNQETYREYRRNIHQYYRTHEESREKLICFVTGADAACEKH